MHWITRVSARLDILLFCSSLITLNLFIIVLFVLIMIAGRLDGILFLSRLFLWLTGINTWCIINIGVNTCQRGVCKWLCGASILAYAPSKVNCRLSLIGG